MDSGSFGGLASGSVLQNHMKIDGNRNENCIIGMIKFSVDAKSVRLWLDTWSAYIFNLERFAKFFTFLEQYTHASVSLSSQFLKDNNIISSDTANPRILQFMGQKKHLGWKKGVHEVNIIY